MGEVLVLGCVAVIPFVGVALKTPLFFPLLVCLAVLFVYGLSHGCSLRSLAAAAWKSERPVFRILFSFLLIGALTAAWRASGTIPFLVYLAVGVCSSSTIIVVAFLACCLFSVVVGTAFGTAATMGPIFVSAAYGLGVDPLVVGGAVLSGSYFGDRCSPLSTSALLVSSLTQTDLFGNISAMLKTSALPFLLACVTFSILGMQCAGGAYNPDELRSCLDKEFWLDVATLLPMAVVLVLALLRVRVEALFGAGILAALPLALVGQSLSLQDMLLYVTWGFISGDAAVDTLLAGGGIVSMVQPLVIVCISSCSTGLLEETGLLHGAKSALSKVAKQAGSFAGVLLTSTMASMVACNQTLTILLAHRLCLDFDQPRKMALYLENSAVVVAALVPWSIASSVPLSAMGAPVESIVYACYLYFVPACFFVQCFLKARSVAKAES